MRAHLQEPTADSLCDPLCFRIEGWIAADASESAVIGVELQINGAVIGSTHELFRRSDVSAALGIAATVPTGFIHFAHVPDHFGAAAELEVHGIRADGSRARALRQNVRFIASDYRDAPYGVMLDRGTTRRYGRDNIYGSGPSVLQGSHEVVDLLRRYLGPPESGRIIDVGCGLGFYGRELRKAGYDWMGAEVKPGDCAELARAGLPHRQVDGTTLPFADREFAAAICIEVLEHIADPATFLREVQRVAPRRLLVSVPNAEAIPYLHRHLAVPWHLLEADHKSFFTRWSLGHLLREFYPQVEVLAHTRHPLSTPEGTAVFYNLFAVASAD